MEDDIKVIMIAFAFAFAFAPPCGLRGCAFAQPCPTSPSPGPAPSPLPSPGPAHLSPRRPALRLRDFAASPGPVHPSPDGPDPVPVRLRLRPGLRALRLRAYGLRLRFRALTLRPSRLCRLELIRSKSCNFFGGLEKEAGDCVKYELKGKQMEKEILSMSATKDKIMYLKHQISSKTGSDIMNAFEFRGRPHFSTSSVAIGNSISDSQVESVILGDYLSRAPSTITSKAIRIFVATWNVGGNTPHKGLSLSDFLPSDDHSDLYVLGFQEIVPLNAGNVLVIEDNEPAAKWLSLINQALNGPIDSETDIESHTSSPYIDSTSSQASNIKTQISRESKSSGGSLFFQKPSPIAVSKTFRTEEGRCLRACNCPAEATRKYYRESCFSCQHAHFNDKDSEEEEEEEEEEEAGSYSLSGFPVTPTRSKQKYKLIARKQMVGIFVTVWVRRELVQYIGHLRVSCIGRGIMGYLGNKGCISLSMSLHRTSFCFVCSHLASGEKGGDELKRNSDVSVILKHTQFRKICRRTGRRIPVKILEHDHIIWLGDLNYRISLSYSETKILLEDNNWDALFEKDQLKIEREAGRVFKGWNEGKIYFAPTYKYSNNSDMYAGEIATSKKKRRTPAWCDRILWHGDGIVQLSYIRGESKFSDHRPVCAVFIVDVGVSDDRSKNLSTPNMRVGAEEILHQRANC
ncbi:type I inositol polyphosphate 5-phosphatase 10-like [Curcuma longa]|uniref:type I inositol polyphosphate 5-phosphatase 10-like n=1 Tax=Curcuma longa TaxID=136217 RepID=UPI003D9FA009